MTTTKDTRKALMADMDAFVAYIGTEEFQSAVAIEPALRTPEQIAAVAKGFGGRARALKERVIALGPDAGWGRWLLPEGRVI